MTYVLTCDICMDLESIFGIFRKTYQEDGDFHIKLLEGSLGSWEKDRKRAAALGSNQYPLLLAHTGFQPNHTSPNLNPSEKLSLFSFMEKLTIHPLNSHRTFSLSLYFLTLLNQLPSDSTLVRYVTLSNLILSLTLQGRCFQHYYFTDKEAQIS